MTRQGAVMGTTRSRCGWGVVLLFAAVDLIAAFFLLLDGGFTIHFVLIALIGLVLAGIGLVGVYRRPRPAE